ncbi:MAG: phosphoglycerate dehydrogenase [Pirellulales bacterium]|nr:phosphoglycerate dehydrogenase [Pirellulales bacterium]
MPRIVILDELSPDGLALLDKAKNHGITYEVRTGLKGDALRTTLAEFDGAICRSGVKITPDALAGNTRLKAIARAGVGTDNIDKDAATRLGIVVMNTPEGNTVSTAELTFSHMLALSRHVFPAYQSLLEKKWDRKNYMGTQLAEKTLGIVGLGRIGLAVARRAQAFEMNVIGFDPFLTREKISDMGIHPAGSIEELLPQVDYLTVHTPLVKETANLINTETIKLLKPGARLVNCARGGIYDEAALVEGLKSGRIAGVALDVFAVEPCTNSPLFGMPGVLCTPHLGASTEDAQAKVAIEAVQLMVNYFQHGSIRNAVNMSPLDAKTLEDLRGDLNVAYRLGLFLAQMVKPGAMRIIMNYRGEVAEKNTKLLTAAFAAGFLEHALEQEANIVNAEVLLRERGIELVELRRSDVGAFSSLITAEVVAPDGLHRAAGTLFGQNMPRLVQIDEQRLEAFLDGTLMIFHHTDMPGIIGRVGTIFGQHKVNIGQMAVGRMTAGGTAIGVLNLDSEPSAAAMNEVRACPGITNAYTIKLPPANALPNWLK